MSRVTNDCTLVYVLKSLAVLVLGGVMSASCAHAADKESRISQAIGRADLVFKGKVESVGEAPLLESGRYLAAQRVEYRVVEVWVGKVSAGDRVVVDHVVVRGSASAEPGKNELSNALFRPGSMLLVIAAKANEHWQILDEEYGTLPANAANEALVRKAIKGREARHE